MNREIASANQESPESAAGSRAVMHRSEALILVAICTALIVLATNVVHQVANSYRNGERRARPWAVAATGTLYLSWGLVLVLVAAHPGRVPADRTRHTGWRPAG